MEGMKKVLLLGHGPSALTALDSLAGQFKVVAVVRQVPQDGHSRDEVLLRARELAVPVLPDAGASGLERTILAEDPDCVVVSSHNRILGARLLRLCRYVNVHYSPLPAYRGRAAINWAIINGEPATAITIHVMSPEVDAGNVLFQRSIAIGPGDTAHDVLTRLNGIQREVLGGTVARHIAGYAGEPQDESLRSYACARVPEDGEIDWSQPAGRIYALVRALSPPWPGAHTYLEARRITVVRASLVREAPSYVGRVPGRVVARSRDGGFADVLTGDGVLRLHEVSVHGGTVVPASSAMTSTTQTLGLRAVDLLRRVEYLEKCLGQASAGDSGKVI